MCETSAMLSACVDVPVDRLMEDRADITADLLPVVNTASVVRAQQPQSRHFDLSTYPLRNRIQLV